MSDASDGNGKPSKKSPPLPLPKSLTNELPAAGEIVKHLDAIVKLYPRLAGELEELRKQGAIKLARGFAVLHRLAAVTEDRTGPIGTIFELYKGKVVPEVFEQAGVRHLPLTEGYRVGVGTTLRASVRKDVREDAFAWMRKEHPDVISETINSSTLSALARQLREDKNIDLPDDLFNVADVPNTSVTKI